MSTTTAVDIDQFAINTAKGLIMDAVRNADSGHTGGPFSSLDYHCQVYHLTGAFRWNDPRQYFDG